MTVYIIKSDNAKEYLKVFSCNLPMFMDEFVPCQGKCTEFIAYFTKPDRYSRYSIFVCPHKIDSKLINNAWNYCIENNLDYYTFEIDE